MTDRSCIINQIGPKMSSPEFTTTMDSEWGDDGSDFGEFSSASPKSDGLSMENHPTTTTNPSTLSLSNRFGQPTHFVRCAGVNSCGEIRLREPNGYVSGQKILHKEGCKHTKTTEFPVADPHKVSNVCSGDVQMISGVHEYESCVSRPKFCVATSTSETADSVLTSCANQHNSTIKHKCQSLSSGDGRMIPSCTDTENSSNCVDGLSLLSGSKLIGSVPSDLGRAKSGCNMTGSVNSQDSHGSSELVSNAESSLPKDVQVNFENSCTHADECNCETCDFDDFQLALDNDDFQERIRPTGKQNHSWASFGEAGGGGGAGGGVDGDDSWLAFQENDLETGVWDDTEASQTADSHRMIIPPRFADEMGKTSDIFSQSEKSIHEFVELVFPTSADTPSSDEKPTLNISETSCDSAISFRPDLLDLIGEPSAKSDPVIDPTRSLSSSAVVWNSLKVMEDTAALKFHWNGSRSNRLLLKSVAMESPTRLNARRIQKLPAARTVQEIADHNRGSNSAAATCRQPYESSFSQTVLSVAHLRM